MDWLNSPKSVAKDSEASRKSVVGIASSLLESMRTSTKDFLSVSNQVPPVGYERFDGTVAIVMRCSVNQSSSCGTCRT